MLQTQKYRPVAKLHRTIGSLQVRCEFEAGWNQGGTGIREWRWNWQVGLVTSCNIRACSFDLHHAAMTDQTQQSVCCLSTGPSVQSTGLMLCLMWAAARRDVMCLHTERRRRLVYSGCHSLYNACHAVTHWCQQLALRASLTCVFFGCKTEKTVYQNNV